MAEYAVVVSNTPFQDTPAVAYTSPNFGMPEACCVIWNRHENNVWSPSIAADATGFSIFFSDGVNHRMIAEDSRNLAATTGNNSILTTVTGPAGDMVYQMAATEARTHGIVPASGLFINDGIQIDHLGGNAGKFRGYVVVILFRALDNVLVDHFFSPADANPTSYTGSSFQPKLILMSNFGDNRIDTRRDKFAFSLSAVIGPAGSPIQRQAQMFQRDQQTIAQQFVSHKDGMEGWVALTNESTYRVTSLDPNGFTMQQAGGGGIFSHSAIALMLDTGSDELELVDMQTPDTGVSGTFKTYGTLDPVDLAISAQTGVLNADTKVERSTPQSNGISFHAGMPGKAGGQDIIGAIGFHSLDGAADMELYSTTSTGQLVDHRSINVSGSPAFYSQEAFMQTPNGDSWIGGGVQLDYQEDNALGWGWILLAKTATGVVIHQPTGSSAFSGATSGDVSTLTVHQPTGASTFTGLTSGRVITMHRPTGSSTFTGLTSGRVVLTHEPAGASTFTGLTSGAIADVTVHQPTGTGTFTGLTSGQVVVAHFASGTSTLSGLTSGAVGIVAQHLPSGTGTFTGVTSGAISTITVGQPTGSSTFTGLTSGAVSAITVHQAAGASTFSGVTAGFIQVAGVNIAFGNTNFTGLTAGQVLRDAIHQPVGTSTFTGLTSGAVNTAGAKLPSGASAFTGLTAGVVLRDAIHHAVGNSLFNGVTAGVIIDVPIWMASGTSIFDGLSDGRIGGGVGLSMPKRICVVDAETRTAVVPSPSRRCTVTEA